MLPWRSAQGCGSQCFREHHKKLTSFSASGNHLTSPSIHLLHSYNRCTKIIFCAFPQCYTSHACLDNTSLNFQCLQDKVMAHLTFFVYSEYFCKLFSMWIGQQKPGVLLHCAYNTYFSRPLPIPHSPCYFQSEEYVLIPQDITKESFMFTFKFSSDFSLSFSSSVLPTRNCP